MPDFSLPSLPLSPGRTSCVVVDSLSTLLLHFPVSSVCRWLVSWSTPSLALVHSDLHSGDVLAQLQYVATSEIDVVPTHKTRPLHHSAVAHVVHRRTSGKVIKQVRLTTLYHMWLKCFFLLIDWTVYHIAWLHHHGYHSTQTRWLCVCSQSIQ